MTQISQSLARPVRTAVQIAPSFVITDFVDAFVYDMSDKQYAALVALLTLAFGYGQVALETKLGKALFRNVNLETAPLTSTDTTPVEMTFNGVRTSHIVPDDTPAASVLAATIQSNPTQGADVSMNSNEVPEITGAMSEADTSIDPRQVADFHVGAPEGEEMPESETQGE